MRLEHSCAEAPILKLSWLFQSDGTRDICNICCNEIAS